MCGFGDDSPGTGHLAALTAFPTGAGAWPGSTSTASDSPSASAREEGRLSLKEYLVRGLFLRDATDTQ